MIPRIYIVRRDTATEALDHLDEFIPKMKKYCEKNPSYDFSYSVKKVDDEYEVEIKVVTDE